MAKNTDTSCLFVLLSSAFATEDDLERQIDKIWWYFPTHDKSRLKTQCKKLIPQLSHPELRKIHSETFRALPFELRYKIAIRAVADISYWYEKNILTKWHHAYEYAKMHYWFTPDEWSIVKKLMKDSIEDICSEGKRVLGDKNQDLWKWEKAQEKLVLREKDYAKDHDCAFGFFYKDSEASERTFEYKLFILCLQLDAENVPAVTKEETCLWGVSDRDCILHALKHPILKREASSYVPHPNNDAIASALLKSLNGDIGTYTAKRIKELLTWLNEAEKPAGITPAAPVVNVSSAESVTKPKPHTKPIADIQKSLDSEMHDFYLALPAIFQTSFSSKTGEDYLIEHNYQRGKESKGWRVTSNIQRIEILFSEYKELFEGIESIDEAYAALCSLSHSLQTFTSCLEHLTDSCTSKFTRTLDTEKILSSCIKHYSTLLAASARQKCEPQSALLNAKKQLAQQLESIASDISTHKANIAAAEKQVEEKEQAYAAAKETCAMHTSLLEAEIATLDNALSMLNASIESVTASIAADRTNLATAQKKLDKLQAQKQTLQREYDQFVEANNRTYTELQAKLRVAEDSLRKTLLFKKTKRAQVAELTNEMVHHQENFSLRKITLENEMSDVSSDLNELNARIEHLTDAIAQNDATRTQLHEERTRIHQQVEEKQKAFPLLQKDVNAAQTAVDTSREELKKHEGKLADAITDQQRYIEELAQNQGDLAAFDESLQQKLLIYPDGYGKTARNILMKTSSNFAFTLKLAAHFSKALRLNNSISALTYRRMHLSALQRALLQLENGKLVSSAALTDISEELDTIDKKLEQLKSEASLACACFSPNDASSIEDVPTAKFIKKANRLFDVLRNHVVDGTVPPGAMLFLLKGTCCLQTSSNCYLCFTPLYIIAIAMQNKKPSEINLIRYTDISFEVEEQIVALDFGEQCPPGATIIQQHWEYETLAGTANRRYTNNPTYFVVALQVVTMRYGKEKKTNVFASAEEANRVIQAFNNLKEYLHEENADFMNRFFADKQMPDIAKIASEVAEERKKAKHERKEQERLLKEQERCRQAEELALKKQREEEKKQKEQQRKRLEQWAESAQKSKAEDDLFVAERIDTLPPITSEQITCWDDQCSQPVVVMDQRRIITNGIMKIEFLHLAEVSGIARYLAFFADAAGKVFSDIRTLPSAMPGTKTVIPFEIKTQSGDNPTKLFMLIRSMEDGKLVGKTEYKLNIAFTNDFDF